MKMEIESITCKPFGGLVTTTGAEFVFTTGGVRLSRRIDPATNDTSSDARRVAEVLFDDSPIPLGVFSASRGACAIDAGVVRYDIRADSLMFIENTSGKDVRLTYKSLLEDPLWHKRMGQNNMWADGDGGSLFLDYPGDTTIVKRRGDNELEAILPPGQRAACAVFPARLFDFEALYGERTRPHVFFSPTVKGAHEDIAHLDELAVRGFGVVGLFHHYKDDERPQYNTRTGRLEYTFPWPDRTGRLIHEAHARGYRVITYMQVEQFKQPVEATLEFMRDFQQRYNLDGWYFDNARIGDWVTTYDFVRAVRRDVGEGGVIYHHRSVSPWSNHGGLVLVPAEAYVDYTLTGETGNLAAVQSVADLYFRFVTCGYGIGGTIGDHKLLMPGKTQHLANVTEAQVARLLSGLHCSLHVSRSTLAVDADDPVGRPLAFWDEHFRPGYEAQKAKYLAGESFKPDVDWPPTWEPTP